MKSLDRMPVGLADSERKIPPAAGLVIAFGSSFVMWALLVWAVL